MDGRLQAAGWRPARRPGELHDPAAPVTFDAVTAREVQRVRDGVATLERAGWAVLKVGVPGAPAAIVGVQAAFDPTPRAGEKQIVSLDAALVRQSERAGGAR